MLFIAHQFPPISASGSFRPAKFVKYLPLYDWQPYVITTRKVEGLEFDPTLCDDFPEDSQIKRISSPFPRPLDRVINWLGKNLPILKSDIERFLDKNWQPNSFFNRVLSLIIKVFLFPLTIIQYPPLDPVLFWSIKIIFPSYKLIRSEQLEVIFTTSAPWSSMLSGLVLKKLTGLSWVADIRDPWTTEELRYRSKSWRGVVNKYFERFFLRNADIVIGVTPNWVADLQRLARQESVTGKYKLITNGYDESDFEGTSIPKLDDISGVEISHIGSMFRGGLEPLLLGFQTIDTQAKERLRFKLIGYIHPRDQESLVKFPFNNAFAYRSKRITHVRALQIMRESHVLLLSLPFEYFPGKVFEYMRVGRPILALVPDGSMADLIQRAQIGCVVNREDTDRISEVLKQIAFDYDGFVNQYYQPDWRFIQRFERKILTKKLSSIFQCLVQ